MKVLIFNCSSLANPHLGVMIDKAISLNNAGHEVTFAYCNGVMHTCNSNRFSNDSICKLCRTQSKIIGKSFYKHIRIDRLKRSNTYVEKLFDFKSVEDLKAIVYKNVKIGYSVLSAYIQMTRNIFPDILDPVTCKYIQSILNEASRLVNNLEQLILDVKPDKILLFNGRLYESRPMLDLAIHYKIDFVCLEVEKGLLRCSEPFTIVEFENILPHNIKENHRRCSELWDKSLLSVEEKNAIGSSFYERRRNGIESADKVYTCLQENNKLPRDFDKNKRNIVIFNSSEDEFIALGDEFDSYALFPSQLDGMIYILEHCKGDEFHFYIRIHPNLIGVNYKFHTNIHKLEECYNNVNIISADSSISTYALMDAAEKVVVFGSTTGIEATYWGKPVILLAGCFYYHMNVCYTPKNRHELSELIKKELSPLSNLPAIHYGFYLLNNDLFSFPSCYVDINPRVVNLFGRKLFIFNYLKVWSSSLIAKLYSVLIYRVFSKINKNRLSIKDKVFVEDL